jgi:hypothetical protein
MGKIVSLTWAGVDLGRRTVTVSIQELGTADHSGKSDRPRIAQREAGRSSFYDGFGLS